GPAGSNQRAILRIANEEHSTDIASREIRAHIEFAGISRRRYRLGSFQQLQFIAKFRRAFPTDLPDCMRRLLSAFELHLVLLEQERCASDRGGLWLGLHPAHPPQKPPS